MYKNSVTLCWGLRAWNVNSPGPTGIINLTSPTLWVWCLVSRVLVSVTFHDTEHHFMCLSAICRLSSEKYPFWSLAHFFFLCLYVFLIMSCMSCLYVLELNSLWVSFLANISSYSEGCPCLSLRVSFWYTKAFKVSLAPFSDLWFIFHFSKR